MVASASRRLDDTHRYCSRGHFHTVSLCVFFTLSSRDLTPLSPSSSSLCVCCIPCITLLFNVKCPAPATIPGHHLHCCVNRCPLEQSKASLSVRIPWGSEQLSVCVCVCLQCRRARVVSAFGHVPPSLIATNAAASRRQTHASPVAGGKVWPLFSGSQSSLSHLGRNSALLLPPPD